MTAQQKRDTGITQESGRLLQEYVKQATATGHILSANDVVRFKAMAARQAEYNYKKR